MSLIKEYAVLEKSLAELAQRIEELRSNPNLAVELEFKTKLEALLDEHDKTLRDVINIIEPSMMKRGSNQPIKARGGARTRRVKQYKNPHTGEVLETKGGNHKELLAWKKKHGAEEVEGWARFLD